MKDKLGRELIPCRLCDELTAMLGTKLCDRCYELKSRISQDPALARKILTQLDPLDNILVEALQAAKRGLAEAMQPHLVPGLRNEYDLVVAALEKAKGE